MNKKLLLSLIVACFICFSSSVFASNVDSANNSKSFFQTIIDSFKSDVIDKTSIWFEKTKAVKDSDLTFYELLHKAFTGKDNNE